MHPRSTSIPAQISVCSPTVAKLGPDVVDTVAHSDVFLFCRTQAISGRPRPNFGLIWATCGRNRHGLQTRGDLFQSRPDFGKGPAWTKCWAGWGTFGTILAECGDDSVRIRKNLARNGPTCGFRWVLPDFDQLGVVSTNVAHDAVAPRGTWNDQCGRILDQLSGASHRWVRRPAGRHRRLAKTCSVSTRPLSRALLAPLGRKRTGAFRPDQFGGSLRSITTFIFRYPTMLYRILRESSAGRRTDRARKCRCRLCVHFVSSTEKVVQHSKSEAPEVPRLSSSRQMRHQGGRHNGRVNARRVLMSPLRRS